MGGIYRWVGAHRAQVGAIVFWLVLFVVARQYMVQNDLTFEDGIRQLRDVLVATWYGPLIYLAAYMVRPLIFFPASLLTVLAGNIYGLALGFVYGLIAGSLSSVVPYAAGRWLATDDTATSAEDDRLSPLRRFSGLMRRNPFQSTLIMRLLYMPYDAVSFFAGMLRIAFLPFITATAIGNIAGTFAFVGIGASIEGDITQGDISLNPAVFAFSLLIFIVSIGISRYLNGRKTADLMGADQHDGQQTV